MTTFLVGYAILASLIAPILIDATYILATNRGRSAGRPAFEDWFCLAMSLVVLPVGLLLVASGLFASSDQDRGFFRQRLVVVYVTGPRTIVGTAGRWAFGWTRPIIRDLLLLDADA